MDAGRLEAGRWTHVAATYDGSDMILYLDGRRVGASHTPGQIRPANRSLILGGYEAAVPDYDTDGYLAALRIYSYTLSENEIKADYQAGAAKITN